MFKLGIEFLGYKRTNKKNFFSSDSMDFQDFKNIDQNYCSWFFTNFYSILLVSVPVIKHEVNLESAMETM